MPILGQMQLPFLLFHFLRAPIGGLLASVLCSSPVNPISRDQTSHLTGSRSSADGEARHRVLQADRAAFLFNTLAHIKRLA
jgi:hypothetical protein